MFLFDELDCQMAMEILNRVKKGLGEFSMNTKHIAITFSGGIEQYQTDSKVDDLFHNVDTKLYQAKNSGKNQVIF